MPFDPIFPPHESVPYRNLDTMHGSSQGHSLRDFPIFCVDSDNWAKLRGFGSKKGAFGQKTPLKGARPFKKGLFGSYGMVSTLE